jgi:CRP-like cAMP-binding protein
MLDTLSPEVRRSVLASARHRSYRAGDAVLHEGAPANALHLLLKGRVAAQTTTPSGETATVNVLGPGDAFGEIALVQPVTPPRNATIVALEPIETLTLTAVAFDELRAREPAVDRLLVQILAAKVTRLTEQLTEAYYAPVDVRVCRCLLRLVERYEARDGSSLIPLTQVTIASMVGATRASVNRVLRELEAEGGITLMRGRIRLDDVEVIARRAAAGSSG